MNIEELLMCPICGRNPILDEGKIRCGDHLEGSYDASLNIYDFLTPASEADTVLSRSKWDEFYGKQSDPNLYEVLEKTYLLDNFGNVRRQLTGAIGELKDKVFLEIGCGPFILGKLLSGECRFVIGVDFSLPALKIAGEIMRNKGILNYLLIHADIRNIPLAPGTVDVLYGGGVLEHFKDTKNAVTEFFRILQPGGVVFNTVPALNIGSLTYRQVWGNIPNLPILKQLAEFIHIKLLGARHMIFGYEYSFTSGTLKKLHKDAGFKDVKVSKFDTKLMFDFIPFKFLKNFCIKLANDSAFFWPMYKVVAKK